MKIMFALNDVGAALAVRCRIILCILSLVIYAALAVQHNLIRNDSQPWMSYDIERAPMASAVSHIVYGAPLGAVYRGVQLAFTAPTIPLNTLFDTAKLRKIELGHLFLYNADGLGAGEAIFATEAMRIFGLHELSIFWGFFSLLTFATITFLIRFNDGRAMAVFAGLSALIFIFATPLGTTAENMSQFAVGGYRYFSLLAAIPAMHVFFELAEHKKLPMKDYVTKHLILLVGQLIIVGIALYVSAATIYVCGLFAVGVIFALFSLRRDHFQAKTPLLAVALVVGISPLLLLAAHDLAPQGYKDAGRNGDLIWHRIFVSLGASPQWPFGTLATEYKGCWPEAPQRSFEPGIGDFNGHCVWGEYSQRHHISLDDMHQELYDGKYNGAMKDAFFEIARRYPIDTLLTFFYYKPMRLNDVVLSLFEFRGPLHWWIFALLIAQSILMLAYAAVDATQRAVTPTRIVFTTFALAGLCTCGLYIAAWSTQWTTGDLYFYILSLIAAAAMTCMTAVMRWLMSFKRPILFARA